jgi:hypothetical protein
MLKSTMTCATMAMTLASLSVVSSAFASWPGLNIPVTVDTADDYTENLSGLKYVVSGTANYLYGIMNGPANIYRLIEDSTGTWIQDPTWTKSGLCCSKFLDSIVFKISICPIFFEIFPLLLMM